MAELSDLITELKEGNKRTQDQLGFMANDSRNSRRHLLEMKKSIFGLAEKLHKTVSEILQMSVEEFNMWIAYFQIQHEERERQERLAKASR